MKWIVVTSKRRYEVEGKRHKDAEDEAWKHHQNGEEILYISPKSAFI